MAHGLSDPPPGLREAEDVQRQRAEEAQEKFRALAPAIRAAEDSYRQESADAFAGVEPDIAGMVEILPLTTKMFLDLDGAGNAFFGPKGTPLTPSDLATFLWRCSPYYSFGKPDSAAIRSFFNGNLYVVPYQKACNDVTAYILRAWAGMPLWKKSTGSSSNLGHWPSRLVHMFAKEYGWGEDYILNLPLRRLWQYANRVLESKDPDYKELCNAAMRLRQEFLEQVNAVTITGGIN